MPLTREPGPRKSRFDKQDGRCTTNGYRPMVDFRRNHARDLGGPTRRLDARQGQRGTVTSPSARPCPTILVGS